MNKYDVYGTSCFYDDETNTAELHNEFIGTFEAEDSDYAKSAAWKSLKDQNQYMWANRAFHGVAVPTGEKVETRRIVTNPRLIKQIRSEYFAAMPDDEREAF